MRTIMSSIELKDLLMMKGQELDSLYKSAQVGRVPTGSTSGWLLFFPGTPVSTVLRALGRLVWQGKLFAADGQSLVNFVSSFRWRSVPAKVFVGRSWLDHNPTIIVDYSLTSIVARYVRDEIREVAPGLYIGQAFVAKRRVFRFILKSELAD